MTLLKVRTFFYDGKLLLLIALCIISYFFNLGKNPIYILDEAKNAQCAREMLQRHDWIVPTFNQQLRTDKPPLHYFFMAAAYQIFGITAFSARIFSAVCGLLILLATYRFTLLYTNRSTAFLSGLVLLSSWQFNFEMRLSVPDPYLILIVTSSLYSFFIFYTSGFKRQKYLFGMYALLGLGILSKGPVAVILPMIAITVFLIIQKRFTFKTIRACKILYGIPLILLIALPWYILVQLHTHGAWTHGFFIKNNINRYLRIRENHGGFPPLTLLYVLAGTMPVSFFLWPVIKAVRDSFQFNVLIQFTAVVTLSIIAFFTLSKTQLPNYPLPAYPFISIIAACYFNQLMQKRVSITISLILMLLVSFLIPIAVFISSRYEFTMAAYPHLWIAFITVPVGGLVTWYLYIRRPLAYPIYAMLLNFLIFTWILNLYAYPAVFGTNPVTKSLKLNGIREPVAALGVYNPAFNFYLKQPVMRFYNADSLKEYLNRNPGRQVITRSRNLVLMHGLHLKLYFQSKDLFENNSTCIMQPAK